LRTKLVAIYYAFQHSPFIYIQDDKDLSKFDIFQESRQIFGDIRIICDSYNHTYLK